MKTPEPPTPEEREGISLEIASINRRFPDLPVGEFSHRRLSSEEHLAWCIRNSYQRRLDGICDEEREPMIGEPFSM
jgi:hypothetical protein